MASQDKRRNLRSWRNRRDAEKARAVANQRKGIATTCWLCKRVIDMDLPPLDRWAWTLDHVESLATGGHILGQLLPAHRSCNSSRGDGTRADPLTGRTRDW